MMVQRRAQYMTVLKVKNFFKDVFIYDDVYDDDKKNVHLSL